MPVRTARRRNPDRGAIAIIVAVFAVVALILSAFVVDRGLAYAQEAQLQSAVDAAALAGAQDLCATSGDPVAVARATALSYGVTNAPSADVQVLTNMANATKYINVQASSQVTQFFSGVAGSERVAVAAQATATATCTVPGYAIYSVVDLEPTGGVQAIGDVYVGEVGKLNSNNNLIQGSVQCGQECQGNKLDEKVTGTVTEGGGVPAPNMAAYMSSIGVTAQVVAYRALSAPARYSNGSGNDCLINTSFYTNNPNAVVVDCGKTAYVTAQPPSGHPLEAILAGDDINIDSPGSTEFTFGSSGSPFLMWAGGDAGDDITIDPQGLTITGGVYAYGDLDVRGNANLIVGGRVAAGGTIKTAGGDFQVDSRAVSERDTSVRLIQ